MVQLTTPNRRKNLTRYASTFDVRYRETPVPTRIFPRRERRHNGKFTQTRLMPGRDDINLHGRVVSHCSGDNIVVNSWQIEFRFILAAEACLCASPAAPSIQVSAFKSAGPLPRLNVNSFRAARGTLQGERADFSIVRFILIRRRQPCLFLLLFVPLHVPSSRTSRTPGNGNPMKSVNRWSNTSSHLETPLCLFNPFALARF